MTNKRLKKDERKNLIQQVSKRVFLNKGLERATMQDIALASELSIGGLYHHYSSTTEIFYDIMQKANTFREADIINKIANKKITINLLSKIIVDKILADNEYIPLYVILLKQVKNNKSLKDLHKQLIFESKLKLVTIFEKSNTNIEFSDEAFELISSLIDSFILGCELLETRNKLKNERKFLEEMIEVLLKKYIKLK